MVHGKNSIPYWIDRRLNGLAGPEYVAIISFGLPIEPEDSQYGESRLRCFHPLGASGGGTLSRTKAVAHDQSGTHDSHCALLFGYIGCRCYCLRHALKG